MEVKELANIIRPLKNTTMTYEEICNMIHVGDYLCLMNTMYPVGQDDNTTLIKTEWVFYPITRKTSKSLYSGSYRWANMGFNFLSTTNNLVASCWLPRHEFEEWLVTHDHYQRVDARHHFLITEEQRFNKPSFTVESSDEESEDTTG